MLLQSNYLLQCTPLFLPPSSLTMLPSPLMPRPSLATVPIHPVELLLLLSDPLVRDPTDQPRPVLTELLPLSLIRLCHQDLTYQGTDYCDMYYWVIVIQFGVGDFHEFRHLRTTRKINVFSTKCWASMYITFYKYTNTWFSILHKSFLCEMYWSAQSSQERFLELYCKIVNLTFFLSFLLCSPAGVLVPILEPHLVQQYPRGLTSLHCSPTYTCSIVNFNKVTVLWTILYHIWLELSREVIM